MMEEPECQIKKMKVTLIDLHLDEMKLGKKNSLTHCLNCGSMLFNDGYEDCMSAKWI